MTATVTDGDGDTASATANIGQNLVFKDDAPVANDDSAGLTEGGSASVTFDVDTNDSNGADGFGSRSFTSLTGSYGTITVRSEEHTSELQSLMRISYAVFFLKKKQTKYTKSI